MQSHEDRGEQVLESAADPGHHKVCLMVVRDDHGPLYGVERFVAVAGSVPALLRADLPIPLRASVEACVRHGWLRRGALVTVRSQRFGECWWCEFRDHELREVDLTEDGTIAVGLWRQRKLSAPPAPEPTLEGTDREVVELAARAVRLGYRIAPRSDGARAQARRLTRDGWTDRGHLGASTRTIQPTARGEVEVLPHLADQGPAPLTSNNETAPPPSSLTAGNEAA